MQMEEWLRSRLKQAPEDFFANASVKFSDAQQDQILRRAELEFRERSKSLVTLAPSQWEALWAEMVREFHLEGHWGIRPDPSGSQPQIRQGKSPPSGEASARVAFFRQVFLSMVVIKGLILYFGANYSAHPGRGYGYGLIVVLAFAASSLVYLAWKYRNVDL